jgi:hypothetical protein
MKPNVAAAEGWIRCSVWRQAGGRAGERCLSVMVQATIVSFHIAPKFIVQHHPLIHHYLTYPGEVLTLNKLWRNKKKKNEKFASAFIKLWSGDRYLSVKLLSLIHRSSTGRYVTSTVSARCRKIWKYFNFLLLWSSMGMEKITKVARLRAGWPGFDFRQSRGLFPFATTSSPALGSTQHPIKRVPLFLPWPGRETDHLPPCSA